MLAEFHLQTAQPPNQMLYFHVDLQRIVGVQAFIRRDQDVSPRSIGVERLNRGGECDMQEIGVGAAPPYTAVGS